jgi:hypothetical protein
MAMVVCLAVCSRAQSPWRFWSHPVVSLSLRYTNTAVRWDNLDVLSPRGARLALSALPSTTLQFATSDEVPEVLERAMLRLPAVKQPAEGIPGAGILVKLFRVLRKDTRSVGDSNRTLWIVGSPHANTRASSKLQDAHKAIVKAKVSHAANTGSASKPRVKQRPQVGR